MNRYFVFVAVLAASVATAAAAGIPPSDHRSGKVISLFNVVSFKQDTCTPSTDPSLKGTCMTATECAAKSASGASADGNCASGFGVCCVFTVKCGSHANAVANNCTYIQNANYPSADTTATDCTFTFNRIESNICRIRLDFVNTVMAGPPTTAATTVVGVGLCSTSGDYVTVASPTKNAIPQLCGTLTGQHMYLSTGDTGTAGSIAFTFGTAVASRTYKIKATYYSCGDLNDPGDGCLQYFTGVTGTIQSYNFAGGVLLDLQDYTTCIRQEQGMCTVAYHQNADTTPDTFDVYNTITVGTTGAEITCTTSYVEFDTTNYLDPSTRCGQVLASRDEDVVSGNVVDTEPPFNLHTYSSFDMAVEASVGGYKIDYSQGPC